MKGTSKNQSSTRTDASFAKKFTDYVADQFTTTKAMKTKREANDKAGKKAENK